MLIPEFRAFAKTLISMPFVAAAHESGLQVLRDAFVQNGFEIGREVSSQLVAPGAPAAYWGGFEVTDPASSSKLRVMASLGYSTSREAITTFAGLSQRWVVTPAAAPAVPMTARERALLTEDVSAHRITMGRFKELDEQAVVAHFTNAVKSLEFAATPAQASVFVARLVDVMAP